MVSGSHVGYSPRRWVWIIYTTLHFLPCLGARLNGASPAYNVEEMTHALKTAGTKFLITLPGSLKAATTACKAAGIPKRNIILLEGESEGFRSTQDLMEAGKWCTPEPPHQIPAGKTNQEVCAFLNFSSGTTGLPKAVMLSHHNMIAQCHQLRQLQVVAPGERYRILAVMPLFHITGLVRFCNYPVFSTSTKGQECDLNRVVPTQSLIEPRYSDIFETSADLFSVPSSGW